MAWLESFEDWPSSRSTTWHGGSTVDVSDVEWARIVPQFMGCGFRVHVARNRPDQLNFARQLAQRVADTFQTELDEAPWTTLSEDHDPAGAQLAGGWELDVGSRRFGAAWTRVTRGGLQHDLSVAVRARTLDHRHNASSPTASLALLSTLEQDAAVRAADIGEFWVGLWLDTTDEVTGTTTGPLLVKTRSGWVFPRPHTSPQSSWLGFQLASALGATPAEIRPQDLQDAELVITTSAMANVYVIGELDGQLLRVDSGSAADAMAARHAVLHQP